METDEKIGIAIEKKIIVQEDNRVLEVGRLLFSVLTPDEILELQKILSKKNPIGNTGDS